MAEERDGIPQIEATELEQLLSTKGDDTIIVDVREVEEYVEGHIPNIPLVPMSSIPTVIDEFDKNKEYVFVCRSGGRSQNVSLYFKDQGFENVINFSGGMLSWHGETNEGMENVVKDIKDLYK